MDYYINSKTGRKRKTGKILWTVLTYLLVFAISFFVSFKLAASTQSGEQEIQRLNEEISSLNSALSQKDEEIESYKLQISNLEKENAKQAEPEQVTETQQ